MENINIDLEERAGVVTAKSQGAAVTLVSSEQDLKTLIIKSLINDRIQRSSYQLVSYEELVVLKVALDKFLLKSIKSIVIKSEE